MGKKIKKWAKKARVILMQELSPVCKLCGETNSTKLTFDCIIPQGDIHHRGSTDQRIMFYRRQHKEHKNIQVLCRSCNSSKQAKEEEQSQFNYERTEENPF